MLCQNCGLGQIADLVTPNKLFKDYRYLSSMSSTFLKHASNFVSEVIKREVFSDQDWVLEIASNDGYLLRNFQREGIEVLGIEPAENVASISNKFGIHTISEFFTKELAENIFLKYGYPKLIIANNVLAHVPDLVNFLEGLRTLCGPDTKISIENPSLVNILLGMQFDTVYHEHFSYLSLHAVSSVFAAAGLRVYDVEELPTHGGSLRVFACHQESHLVEHPSVAGILSREVSAGLLTIETYHQFQERADLVKNGFLSFLLEQKQAGRSVAAYGGAAKGNTLLNYAGVKPDLLPFVCDRAVAKQGKFLPGSHIPILSPEVLAADPPDFLIILPWNIAREVEEQMSFLREAGTKFVTAIPQLRIW
jgi:hypothetical protein